MTGPSNISLADTLQLASTCVNGCRFADAVRLSQSILQVQPDNPDALHILGLSLHNLGQHQQAEPVLAAAAKARSSDPAVANSFAQALLALGRTDDAAAKLEKFARKGKLTPAGLTTLGDCRLRQNQPEKALACFKKALNVSPGLIAARVNYGEALKKCGDLAGAIEHYTKLIHAEPAAQSAWRNLGLALQEAERFEESVSALHKYLERRPDDLQSRLSLAAGYFQTADFENALSEIETVLAAAPNHAEAWNNKGLALRTLERLNEAEAAFQKAITLDPGLGEARTNLANLVHDLRGIDATLEIFDQALRDGANIEKAHVDRSFPLLIEGRIKEGWAEYRWSEKPQSFRPGWRPHKGTYWTGEELTGKTILIWGEQGVGDEIIYASMISDVIGMAGRVLIECEPRLVPLFARSFKTAQVFARASQIPAALKQQHIDFHISVADLCPLLRPDLDSFGVGHPYLVADQDIRDALRKKYLESSTEAPIVGIAWRSGRKNNAWLKSIPLKEWTPIIEARPMSIVSLQYGDHAAEIEAAQADLNRSILCDTDIDPLRDMDAFASQVAAMDLVITNSNTAAHVAGALGVPTWVMVPRAGSGGMPWYWLKDGTQSPWYRSLQLYRQVRFQDWEAAVSAVAADVAEFAAEP